MLRLGFLALCLLTVSQGFADEIAVRNVRPSRMLAFLVNKQPGEALVYNAKGKENSLIPEGLTVKADDRKSVFVVEGPKADIQEFAHYVSLFDVKPRMMDADILIESPIDKFTNRTSTTLRNNDKCTIKQDSIGLSLILAARINDDNTVTVFISSGQKSGDKAAIVKVQFGKIIQVVLDDLLSDFSKESAVTNTGNGVLVGKKGPHSTVVTLTINAPREDSGPKQVPPQALKPKA